MAQVDGSPSGKRSIGKKVLEIILRGLDTINCRKWVY